tara:strand:- start:2004 stop:2903 length:900 start_codon:yes stop_codon:yes gene_type:complete
MTKHFIDISEFDESDLRNIFDFAKEIKNNPNKFIDKFKNKSLGMIFEKQSTRTRVSFDIGMKKMGGNTLELNENSIGFGTRESESDIIRVLSEYLDCLLIRNDNHDLIKTISDFNYLPIINGLSNYSHPCQILSDIFTFEELKGSVKNKTITWIGDINNVLFSLLHASTIFNFNLNIASSKTILDKNHSFLLESQNKKNVNFFDNVNKAIRNSSCIMTDVWISMGEKEDQKKIELLKEFQINDKLFESADNDPIFMHCLPAKRNMEVTDSVIDGNKSVVWQQAQNRMFVQQGILNYCLT